MPLDSDIKIKYKIWFQNRTGKDFLGKGGADLLEAINEFHDLGKARVQIQCSYKYAWNLLQKIKKNYGESPVITYRGGKGGGGGLKLSPFGLKLLRFYKKFKNYVESALNNSDLWQTYGLYTDLSNNITGRVIDVKSDPQVTILKIQIEPPQDIYSIITTESVKDLELVNGKKVLACIKSTEVLVSMEEEP